MPVDEQAILHRLEAWRSSNGLRDVSKLPDRRRFRFGSPWLSNPIYIEVSFSGSVIHIEGWVQTIYPSFTWKLVEVSEDSLLSKLDYRRKGGLLLSRLLDAIGQS